MARRELSTDESRRVQDRLELAARSIFQSRHLPAPDSTTLSQIVGKAMASVSPSELRQSGGLSDALLGRVAGLIENTVQSGAPRNIFAGPDARHGDNPGGTRFGPGKGGYYADLSAALAARRNEAGDGGSSGGTSSSGTAAGSGSAACNNAFLGAAGNPAFLASQGLTPGVGKALAGLGFKSPEQIKEIVRDAKQIGLPPAAAAVPLGTIRKFEGPERSRAFVKSLTTFADRLKSLREQEKEADKIKDAAKKAEAKRKIAEKRDREVKRIEQDNQRSRTPQGKKAGGQLIKQLREQDQRLRDPANAAHKKAQNELSAANRRLASSAVEDQKRRDVAAAGEPEAKKLAAGDAFLTLGEKQPDGNPPEKPKIARAESAKPEAAKPDPVKPDVVKKAEPPKPTRMAAGGKGPNVG